MQQWPLRTDRLFFFDLRGPTAEKKWVCKFEVPIDPDNPTGPKINKEVKLGNSNSDTCFRDGPAYKPVALVGKSFLERDVPRRALRGKLRRIIRNFLYQYYVDSSIFIINKLILRTTIHLYVLTKSARFKEKLERGAALRPLIPQAYMHAWLIFLRAKRVETHIILKKSENIYILKNNNINIFTIDLALHSCSFCTCIWYCMSRALNFTNI